MTSRCITSEYQSTARNIYRATYEIKLWLNHKSVSIQFTWCHCWSILIRYYLLSDIYQIPKICIRLQVTMGCCKFIFVYTTRTIITVSPEINIIFKKRRISSHIPKWYLEKDTLYSCQVFLRIYFYFWKACLISQLIFTWYWIHLKIFFQ